MTILRQIQTTFLQELFSPPNRILLEINAQTTLSASQQFTLYQDSVLLRFQKSLKSIYPVCHALVGDDFFQQMTQAFITTTPSTFPDLNRYGFNFPDFIGTYAPVASVPYLSDVAKFEWAWHRIYSAPDYHDFDFSALAKQAADHPDDIVFSLPLHSTLIASPYPLRTLWEMHQPNYSGNEQLVLPPNSTYFFFIFRGKYGIQMEQLSETAFEVLRHIEAQYSIKQLCDKITETYADFPLSERLGEWLAEGWIKAFNSPLFCLE